MPINVGLVPYDTSGELESTETNNGKTNFNQERKKNSCEDLKSRVPIDSLQFFLKRAFLDESYQNSVILGHGRNYLNWIYKSFLELGIEPNMVLRKSGKIIRIVTELNNLSFVCADEYLHTSLKCTIELDEQAIFFPLVLNYQQIYDWKNIPLQYFFSILDSPLVIERKTQFYKKYEDSNWNLKDLLQQFLHYELEKLMSSCLSIEEFSIELQNSLKTSSRLKE